MEKMGAVKGKGEDRIKTGRRGRKGKDRRSSLVEAVGRNGGEE